MTTDRRFVLVQRELVDRILEELEGGGTRGTELSLSNIAELADCLSAIPQPILELDLATAQLVVAAKQHRKYVRHSVPCGVCEAVDLLTAAEREASPLLAVNEGTENTGK